MQKFYVFTGEFHDAPLSYGKAVYLATDVDARIAELERVSRELAINLQSLDKSLITQMTGWATTKAHDDIVVSLAAYRAALGKGEGNG